MEILEADGPAFCKIITAMGDYVPDLRIPTAFVRRYGDVLPEKATLKTEHPGKSWTVKIEKRDGDCWLTHGWQQFLKENNLNFPDFVVFRLVKDSKFLVTIFDKSGCKRDAPTHIPEQENPRKRIRKHREISKASSTSEESRNTKFTFKWQKYMRNCMAIRESICNKVGLAKQKTLKLKNLKGDTYEVNLFNIKDGRVAFGGGWRVFLSASNLVLNQTYQFEFVRDCNNELLLQLNTTQNRRSA